MRPAASAVFASSPLSRLHDVEQFSVLVDQCLVVGVEILRRDAELVGPADLCRHRIGEILVGAHDAQAREIDGLARQVRQRLSCIDLPAPLGQDRLELGERGVVGAEHVGWLLRGCGRLLRQRRHCEAGNARCSQP
jgi:hypothetical protein